MSATPRLYVAPDLAEGMEFAVDSDQAHYLTRVMRLAPGAAVRVFNGRDGEFEARLASSTKSTATLKAGARMREQAPGADLWLLFAPLKKARTDLVVEKAVELGVSEIRPVLTERTDADTVRTDRLKRITIEAAEQTERLDVPDVLDAVKLDQALAGWDKDRLLIYADEAGDDAAKPWGGPAGRGRPLAEVAREAIGAKAAILIGPEGGFNQTERARLRSLPYVKPITLGPRILRAETAAIAALALWQAIAGDAR
ncbi:MAG TPA: 16S rRNA (uracil(1498)-N(3))-methyltransferase [Hyphomonadaceae bacterium]|nr:16S rRNA (uracil(1498)-N(3))-methyltransferase [Hyphomonadaceae bacterium]